MENYYRIKDVEDFSSLVELTGLMQQNINNFSLAKEKKTLISIFFNPSLRTRMSTSKAAGKLGILNMEMNATDAYNIEFLPGAIMNGKNSEHIKEAAKVLSQYGDAIAIRSFPGLKSFQEDLKDRVLKGFMEYSEVPVINLESCLYHPLQGLTDAVTIENHKRKSKPKVVLSWAPHPKALPLAVPCSFANAANAMDYELCITHPKGFELPEELIGSYSPVYDQELAFENADFIYAKSWSSTENYGIPSTHHKEWLIDKFKFGNCPGAHFMHCLPVRRNVVVSDEVIDSSYSLVYKQANNRTYAAQAVLYKVLN